MAAVMADTQAVVWYLETSPQLSATALKAMESAGQNGDPVYVSSISLVEIAYLEEKRRVTVGLFDRLLQELRKPGVVLKVVAFNLDMADALRRIPAAIVSDMPDRMIAATALHLGVALVTSDRKIQAAPLATIW